jgi:hypothetical protein
MSLNALNATIVREVAGHIEYKLRDSGLVASTMLAGVGVALREQAVVMQKLPAMNRVTEETLAAERRLSELQDTLHGHVLGIQAVLYELFSLARSMEGEES